METSPRTYHLSQDDGKLPLLAKELAQNLRRKSHQIHDKKAGAIWAPFDLNVEEYLRMRSTLEKFPLQLASREVLAEKKRPQHAFFLASAVCVCGALSTSAYEQLNVRDPGCGHFITLCEYITILLLNCSSLRSVPKVSAALHLVMLGGFLGYSILCNYALASSLPVVAVLIMKNGNMVADVIMGRAILRRHYSTQQLLAVLAVSGGISIAALATHVATKAGPAEGGNKIASDSFVWGIGCVVLALLARAGAGVGQEIALQKSGGAASSELLVWRCVLGLPILCFTQWRSIKDHAVSWITSEPQIELWNGGVSISVLWLFMACNLLFDYLTKLAVTRLIFRTSSLTCSLVLILMRFLCIGCSVLANAPPYPPVWMLGGCILVIGGTISYVVASTGHTTIEKVEKKAN